MTAPMAKAVEASGDQVKGHEVMLTEDGRMGILIGIRHLYIRYEDIVVRANVEHFENAG